MKAESASKAINSEQTQELPNNFWNLKVHTVLTTAFTLSLP
jgi:hypothetical protein